MAEVLSETWSLSNSFSTASILKTIFTAAKDKETSTGELTQIESGVPSVLGSF